MPNPREGDRAASLSERVYGAMLWAYLKEFREEYGAQMAQAFGDLRRQEVGRAGASGLILLWARTFLDLLLSASAERGRTSLPTPSSSGLIRFGGLAALVGGALGIVLVARDFSMFYAGVGSRTWTIVTQVLDLVGVVGILLLAVGTLGLYACVASGSRRLATAGLALVLFSDVVFVGTTLYQSLIILSSGYPRGGPIVSIWITMGVGVLALAGSLLLGIALLRARALGRWSALPLGIWLLPLASLVLAVAGPVGSMVLFAVFLALPGLLGNLGWMLVGYLLWSGRSRGTAGPARAA